MKCHVVYMWYRCGISESMKLPLATRCIPDGKKWKKSDTEKPDSTRL